MTTWQCAPFSRWKWVERDQSWNCSLTRLFLNGDDRTTPLHYSRKHHQNTSQSAFVDDYCDQDYSPTKHGYYHFNIDISTSSHRPHQNNLTIRPMYSFTKDVQVTSRKTKKATSTHLSLSPLKHIFYLVRNAKNGRPFLPFWGDAPESPTKIHFSNFCSTFST